MTRISSQHWVVGPEPVDSAVSASLLRAYYVELVGRFWGPPATADQVDAAMAEEPSDHLVAPHGVFLVARLDGQPAGCAGVVLLDSRVAELKRVFVRPEARGAGGGGALISAAESAARSLGAAVLRLDTRADLVEARGLYAKHGFREIPAYNDNQHADHWFEKRVSHHIESDSRNQLTST